MRQHQVELQLQTPAQAPVRVHRLNLVQVLINLVRNALDAIVHNVSSARLIHVEVGRDERGYFVRVRDSGPGVPQELRDRIFNLGFTTKTWSRGLGLHFCANFLEEMGGRLELEPAQPERGASFLVRLPATGATR
jgi:C4-dicarboxylate-specific signal transduction histidine kinase